MKSSSQYMNIKDRPPISKRRSTTDMIRQMVQYKTRTKPPVTIITLMTLPMQLLAS